MDLRQIGGQGESSRGLFLNMDKCKVLSHSESSVNPALSALPGLQYVHASHAVLLGSPLGREALQALRKNLTSWKWWGTTLPPPNAWWHYHPVALSIPKLLHILWASPAYSSPCWDNLLKFVSWITKINFDQRDSWLQATLPVRSGSLGLWSASTLEPSARLAPAGWTSDLIQQLLPDHLSSAPYPDRDLALRAWKHALPKDAPTPSATNQKSYQPVVQHMFATLLDHCMDEISRSRLLGVGSSESGAWLNTPPTLLTWSSFSKRHHQNSYWSQSRCPH